MIDNPRASVGMGQMILNRAVMTPDAKAITFEGETLTFATLSEHIRDLAVLLAAIGVGRGDRVGYIGLNHPRFLELLYASSVIGAIFVPLNYRLSAQEIAFTANDADLKVIFADEESASIVEQKSDELTCDRFIGLGFESVFWESLADLLTSHALADTGRSLPIQQIGAEDVALIMYTSGTTGKPKGALLTHGNIFWNLLNAKFMEETMRGATLTCAPLFHIGGLNVTTHPSLVSGVHVVLHREFIAKKVLEDIEQYAISTLFGAPTMFDMLTHEKVFAETDFSSIIALNCGAAPVSHRLIETYAQKGVPFCQGYGLTETAPYVSVLSTEDSIRKKGSAGKPLMFTAVRIVDDHGHPLLPMEKGEICVSGPNVTVGYWGLEDATREAFDVDGWFRTGDIGYFDEEGYLFICDRKKDMIISGGENVYPAEVESELLAHPAIKEAAVIGLPDQKWGERVAAVVTIFEEAQVSLEELSTFLAHRLARYKHPREIHIVDTLPRNPAGKIQKRALREELASNVTVDDDFE